MRFRKKLLLLILISSPFYEFSNSTSKLQANLLEQSNTPAQTMNAYFEQLNQHNFDKAYSYLSASWNLSRKDYRAYWEKFNKGTLKATILSVIWQPSNLAAVKTRIEGINDNQSFELEIQCNLREAGQGYRIENCQ